MTTSRSLAPLTGREPLNSTQVASGKVSVDEPAVAVGPFAGPQLIGTVPVRPFADRFFGHIAADGQLARVAAVACEPSGSVVLLSVVGYDTTVSAAIAHLHAGKALAFTPADDLMWAGPQTFTRPNCGCRQVPAPLAQTTERHLVAYARTADIAYGLLDAVVAPPADVRPDAPLTNPSTTTSESTRSGATAGSSVALQVADRAGGSEPRAPEPRYLFGNWDERTPNLHAFLGNLRTLRVIHLSMWADTLWRLGLEQTLIEPLPALGVRAWRISDDLLAWGQLLSDGVRSGLLQA